VRRRVPLSIARAAGGALELAWHALHLSGEPPMTRFVATQLASSHSYSLAPPLLPGPQTHTTHP
jgi:hypothetical protein